MDNQLVFDLFSNTCEAAKVLNADTDFCDTLKNMRRQLPPMQVGQYGQLQEWFEDWDHPNDRHRHISHLWGYIPVIRFLLIVLRYSLKRQKHIDTTGRSFYRLVNGMESLFLVSYA